MFGGRRDHWQHDLELAMCGSAAERPQLNAEDVGPCKRQPDAAKAKERIAFLRLREAAIGLSAPTSSVRIVTGLPPRPFRQSPIGGILLLFVRQVGAATEKKFGPHEADAVKPVESKVSISPRSEMFA